MSKDNREVKTDLYNILSHVSCAVDYGYYDDVLMSDFAGLTGYVTDKEIEAFILDSKSEEYTKEDYDSWRDRIVEWRDRYCKDTGEVTINSGVKSNKCYNEECGVNTDLKCQLTGGADKCGLRMDEPMEDSGADVCEWEYVKTSNLSGFNPGCSLGFIMPNISTRECPECGKIISIKGE